MEITMMHGKIHRATVTGAQLNYVGSITIDRALLDAAGILPYEAVQVVNVATGGRLVTYAIEGERGSGEICLNGAAARMAQVGDKVIIMAYGRMTVEEAAGFSPKVVVVDEGNGVCEIRGGEEHGEIA